jgi:hypothetical protein
VVADSIIHDDQLEFPVMRGDLVPGDTRRFSTWRRCGGPVPGGAQSFFQVACVTPCVSNPHDYVNHMFKRPYENSKSRVKFEVFQILKSVDH